MDKKLTILQVHNFYQLPGGEDTAAENERCLLEEHAHRVICYCRDNKELKHFSFFRKLLLPHHATTTYVLTLRQQLSMTNFSIFEKGIYMSRVSYNNRPWKLYKIISSGSCHLS